MKDKKLITINLYVTDYHKAQLIELLCLNYQSRELERIHSCNSLQENYPLLTWHACCMHAVLHDLRPYTNRLANMSVKTLRSNTTLAVGYRTDTHADTPRQQAAEKAAEERLRNFINRHVNIRKNSYRILLLSG